MKFEPRRGQAVGRVVIRPAASSILRPDETKGTKFVMLDAVGPDLEAKGLHVGDIVLPIKINSIVLDSGTSFRPLIEEESVALVVRDWTSLDEFRVQTENGSEYVPFSDSRAAISLGAIAGSRASRSAAA